MLTHRTNVLLTHDDYTALVRRALVKGKTIGELIRQAIRETYKIGRGKGETFQIMQRIDKLAQKVSTKGINLKRLIEDGRKY